MALGNDDRIRAAALSLYLRQGIRKTSFEDVAKESGVARATVYRRFPSKEPLVRAAFGRVLDALAEFKAGIGSEGGLEVDEPLERCAAAISRTADGRLPAALAELERLYPDLAAEFSARRRLLMQGVADELLSRAEASGRLRPGLEPIAVRAVLAQAIAGVLGDPGLAASGLDAAAAFRTARDVLLYGLLIPRG